MRISKLAIACASLMTLSACHHNLGPIGSASAAIPADPAVLGNLMLARYEASEFEPTWYFKLNGNSFQMSHPGLSVPFVTGTITKQTRLTNGKDWMLEGISGAKPITVIIDNNLSGCVHSGTADHHTDDVMVVFDGAVHAGCGGGLM